jgi:uncharacterized protein (TIRG00374 family)
MKDKFRVLRLLLSLGLVVALVLTTELKEALAIVAGSNRALLLLALVVALADRVLMAYKWGVLLQAKKIQIPLASLTSSYLISNFLGVFLPATVGGDALRAYAVSRDGHKFSDVVSSIIVERLLGFVALFLLALASVGIGLLTVGQNLLAEVRDLFWVFLLLLCAATVLILLSLNRGIAHGAQQWLRTLGINWSKSGLILKLAAVYQSYQSYRYSPKHLAAFLALTVLENLFPVLWTYLLALAFQLHIPVLYFFILVPIVLVLVRLPISLDGFGIQEGTFVFFLSLVGVAQSEALLLGLASHFVALASILPGGALYSQRGLKLKSRRTLEPTPELGPRPENANPGP